MNGRAVNQPNKRSMNDKSKNLYLFEYVGLKYLFNKCLARVKIGPIVASICDVPSSFFTHFLT